MEKNNNLKDLLVDIANAIRAKKGTTGLINPQDFATYIASIETGSGGGGLITFSVGSYGDLTAVEGMTWFEFCNSEYNIHEFFANPNNGEVLLRSESDEMGLNYTDIVAYDDEKGRFVWSDDVIISGKHYGEKVW